MSFLTPFYNQPLTSKLWRLSWAVLISYSNPWKLLLKWGRLVVLRKKSILLNMNAVFPWEKIFFYSYHHKQAPSLILKLLITNLIIVSRNQLLFAPLLISLCLHKLFHVIAKIILCRTKGHMATVQRALCTDNTRR